MTYLNSRGEHAFYIDNVNAPAPWLNGARPQATLYNNDNIYQYGSGGIFRQNQLIANIRVSTGKRLSLFGFYTLNYANSNASSGGSAGGFFSSGGTSSASFLSNQFDPLADYGRAAFDVRHRAFIGGNITLPYAFSLSPFIIINSGQPYNLTTGQDNNGDSIFNDRPSFVSANENAVCTTRSTDFLRSSVTAFRECAGELLHRPIEYNIQFANEQDDWFRTGDQRWSGRRGARRSPCGLGAGSDQAV